MALSTGTRLGPYEIVAAIGSGGMGEVYRARDRRLNRLVAIKVLSSRLIAGLAARDRFEREAQAIAALSHPNICTLYDVGREGDVEFLVMEYLEGETLAERLARQPLQSAPDRTLSVPSPRPGSGSSRPARAGARAPLPLDETLRIAAELADALAAAHRAGVVHRDLKPSNVMLTKTGVKVLDFGLAKLRPSPDGTAIPADQSADTAAPLTGAGVFVGTLPYMAPEQLEGRVVDSRADLFSLGAIVYEMVTGRRAFEGDSQVSLMAAILDRDPDPVTVHQPLVSPGVERLVRKCLAKDPDARWQSAGDLADELRWLAAGSGSGAAPVPARGERRMRPRVRLAVAALMTIASGIGVVYLTRDSDRTTSEVRHQQMTFTGDVAATALSPDGRTIAFATGEPGDAMRLFVRDLAGGQALEIWKGTTIHDVAWLPDGSRLAISGVEDGARGLWLVPRLGGTGRPLGAWGAYVAASPDGSELAVASQAESGFRLISIAGGPVRTIQLSGFRWIHGLDWTARANRIVLLTIDESNRFAIWTGTPEGRDLNQVYSDAEPLQALCASPVGDVAYVLRERTGVGELLRIPLAPGARTTTLLSGLPVATGDDLPGRCTITTDGERLLYLRGSRQANLWRVGVAGRESMPTVISRGTSQFASPAVSPDGKWIGATEGPESSAQVVKLPIDGGEPIRLGPGMGPVWSPDGRRMAVASDRGNARRVWLTDPDGQHAREIQDAALANPIVHWWPDGRLLWQTPDARNFRIRDLQSGRDEMLVKDESRGWVFEPHLSPQSDRVAVFWNRSDGRRGLWVLSWPGREERFLAPRLRPQGWSQDGRWIYAHPDSGRTVVRIHADSGKAQPVATFPVGSLGGNLCNMTPDRQTLICALTEAKADAWLMEHFDQSNPRMSQ
jgi:serine/threonine protein kinase/WD40 repeat protein